LGFLERFSVLDLGRLGATFLLNSPFGPADVWDRLPRQVQRAISERQLRFHVIDANAVAQEVGMGNRVNTIMQTCFFALSGVLPRDEAIAAIKHAIEKTYGKRGELVVQRNFEAVDAALAHLYEVQVPSSVTSTLELRQTIAEGAPARRYPGQSLRSGAARRGSRRFRQFPCAMEGISERRLFSPGCTGGLHRLRLVRRGLSGEEQDGQQSQGHQHGPPGAAAHGA